ncbi:hypothetical protein EDD86DRAFT_271281, partial [Gorgonomyces haynaldii]
MKTCAEECSQMAKTFTLFADPGRGLIPSNIVCSCMGLAIFKGSYGVAVVRLKDEWSAPCAILLQAPNSQVSDGQESVVLFMTEQAIFSLVGRTPLVLGQTHSFAPGPMYQGSARADCLVYVRFNNGFTPGELIQQHMQGWGLQEDVDRHMHWHGDNATWFDVLTNKISVDRSSVGNALYLVLNLGASGGRADQNNVANITDWAREMESKQEEELKKSLGLLGTKTPQSSPQMEQSQPQFPSHHQPSHYPQPQQYQQYQQYQSHYQQPQYQQQQYQQQYYQQYPQQMMHQMTGQPQMMTQMTGQPQMMMQMTGQPMMPQMMQPQMMQPQMM